MAVDEFHRASEVTGQFDAQPDNDHRDPSNIQTLTVDDEVAVEYHQNGNIVTEYGTVTGLHENTEGTRPLSSVEVDLELRPVRIMWDGLVSELPESDDDLETELGRWATVRRVETDGGESVSNEHPGRARGTKNRRLTCPFCTDDVGNLPNHLPCDGNGGDA
ncbi:hypothetical protein [Haloarchaeobius sp. DFWS5]|uniref:hypothetical protein n=1 Tax=Haloarchaeobius sp. DFWS5 TaxID=3446114 RepID=UPI003EBAD5FA